MENVNKRVGSSIVLFNNLQQLSIVDLGTWVLEIIVAMLITKSGDICSLGKLEHLISQN